MGRVYILAPGGQYNHLIFRRVTELGYEASIHRLDADAALLQQAGAFIIGGGPARLSLNKDVS
ncbi:MAG: hypothetical protein QXP58_09695, partial [Thermoprotei archaeon]